MAGVGSRGKGKKNVSSDLTYKEEKTPANERDGGERPGRQAKGKGERKERLGGRKEVQTQRKEETKTKREGGGKGDGTGRKNVENKEKSRRGLGEW